MQTGAIETPITVTFPRERHRSQYREPKPGVGASLDKRAKYLLRGIRDLLDAVVEAKVAMPDTKGSMRSTAETVYLNPMVERQRYEELLHASVPTPPHEPAAAAPPGAGTTSLTPEQTVHRDKITVSDVMGHALVQPFRHAISLGKPTRNPSYLPSSVFTRTLVDLLTPQLMEPSFADIERASGRSKTRRDCSSLWPAS